MSDKLLRELSGAQWTPLKMEKLQMYLSRVTRSLKMSVMPPSAASLKMRIRADVILDGHGKPMITGQVRHEMSQVGKRLMKELPTNQISHRSRVETTFANLTQANEFQKRLVKARDSAETLKSFIMPSDVSKAVHEILLTNMLKRLTFDPEHISAYVNDHKKSSASGGVKWADLPDPFENGEWWRNFVDMHRSICEYRLAHPGEFPSFDFNIGGRARPEMQTQRNITDYDFESERSRIVMFYPALSTIFAAMPDKKGWYEVVWREICELFGVTRKIYFPPVDGGIVYLKFAEALMGGENFECILGDDYNLVKGGTHVALDGSNWEQTVGMLMGDQCTTAFATFGDQVTLPSGVAETTILGSIALLWLIIQMEKQGIAEIPGIFERQPEDEAVKFFLGLRYLDDPAYPRLQGLKLSTDRADKAVKLIPSKPTILNSKYSTSQALGWYNAYFGLTLDGGSLLDPFVDVNPGDWMSPSVLIDRLIMDE
jgi:hypothetical protein